MHEIQVTKVVLEAESGRILGNILACMIEASSTWLISIYIYILCLSVCLSVICQIGIESERLHEQGPNH